jgi:hypothetical protein
MILLDRGQKILISLCMSAMGTSQEQTGGVDSVTDRLLGPAGTVHAVTD